MSEQLPKALGRYEIQEEIGRGMMGVVYKALDPALGRAVALKTVQLAFSIGDEDRQVFEKRFLVEARAAASLSHPGILVVHDVGRDVAAGTLFIALEFLDGQTLADMTSGGAPIDWREALRITERLAEALHHAHAAGIVHRDIKPANIMILPSGEPKIMDFGIAKLPTSQLTSAGEFFGTPSYMSPEQASGEAVDGRSDLFSLGSVLYLLLTGRRAFDATSVPTILARIANQDPPAPSRIVPGLPAEVDYLVRRALAKNPSDRYPDGKTIAEDIEDLLAGRPTRHRAGWSEPARAEGTLVSRRPVAEPDTEDLSMAPAPHRPAAPPPPTPPRVPAAGEASLVLRLADRVGTRGLLALGGLVVAGLAVAVLTSRSPAPAPAPDALPGSASPAATPEATPAPSLFAGLPFLTEPAHLEVVFEHSLKSGTLKLWIDDDPVLEEPLESRVTRKILSMRLRKGTIKKVLDVSPGEHVVRVEVQGDGYRGSRKIRGKFEGGVTKRLEVNKGGILKKELSLDWS